MRPIDMLALMLDVGGSEEQVIECAIARIREDTKALARISGEVADLARVEREQEFNPPLCDCRLQCLSRDRDCLGTTSKTCRFTVGKLDTASSPVERDLPPNVREWHRAGPSSIVIQFAGNLSDAQIEAFPAALVAACKGVGEGCCEKYAECQEICPERVDWLERSRDLNLESLQYVYEQLIQIAPTADDNRPIEAIARRAVENYETAKLAIERAPKKDIPDGWALVPIEPTEAMHAAANREWDGRMSARSAGVWQAMIGAAPGYKPPEQWRHVKTDGFYTIRDRDVRLESDGMSGPVYVTYRSEHDGQVWARVSSVFFDGRFQRQPSSSPKVSMPFLPYPKSEAERCDKRYPVPMPRDEPFPVTYRCALMVGHQGPCGSDYASEVLIPGERP